MPIDGRLRRSWRWFKLPSMDRDLQSGKPYPTGRPSLRMDFKQGGNVKGNRGLNSNLRNSSSERPGAMKTSAVLQALRRSIIAIARLLCEYEAVSVWVSVEEETNPSILSKSLPFCLVWLADCWWPWWRSWPRLWLARFAPLLALSERRLRPARWEAWYWIHLCSVLEMEFCLFIPLVWVGWLMDGYGSTMAAAGGPFPFCFVSAFLLSSSSSS